MGRRQLWLMWWSGLLAAATVVHLLRVMTGIGVMVGATVVPLWVSWVIFPVAGGASLWLIRNARGVG